MSTYAAMRQTLISILNRSDTTDPNAALVKSWFDSSIQLIQREVRAPHMERVLTVDTTNAVATVPVPVDWVQTKAWVWDDGTPDGDEIDFVDLGTYYRRKNAILDVPTIYTRETSNWLVTAPIPAGATSKIIYWGEETPLVNDSDETTLSKIAPDLIISGALIFAARHFIDDRKDAWSADFEFLREQVQTQASEGETQNGAEAVQPFTMYDDGV